MAEESAVIIDIGRHNRILRQSTSWLEFEANVQKLDAKRKGDCFEDLVFCYLRLHPNYATKLAHVWRLRGVPPKVRNHLNLPGPDEGIDIVAKTKEGEYWAIQCKYREDATKSLSRRELSTFTDLAFGICRNIKLALVCTTAERFSHKLKLYGERISFVCGDKWRELNNEFFGRLHRLLAGKIAFPKPLRPRLHQKRAIQNARKYFDDTNNNRGKLIMPCAAGKSLSAYWIAEKLEARSVLIAVPSLHLIRQTLEVWARESLAQNKDIHWVCVCSDVTVADFRKEDLAVLAQDLGIRIHTDSDEIAEWLRKRKREFTVVITTYQSGRAIAEATRKAKWIFDIGIMDEAHKTAGKRDSLFSHLLCDDNIKIKKRIFMTATERRYLGVSDQIVSMEDVKSYGETFELLTFKEALESKPPILTDYRIITINVTRQEVSSLIRKNLYVRPDKGKWDEDVEAEMLAAAVALRKAIKKHRIRHALSFHSSIARARAFKATQDVLTEAFPVYGNLQTFHVSGTIPTGKRKREIENFEQSHRALMTNARCLTEGVDVPNIDSVLFADPRKSTIDIVQAVGRALRPSPGKKIAYVIVPVLIDTGEGLDSLINGGAFDPVLTVLRALAANDDRIIEYFQSISQGRRPRRGTHPVDLDISVGSRINAEEFIRSVDLKIWSRLARLSWRPFEEARTFARSLNFKNHLEWNRYCKGELPEKKPKPFDIPFKPERTYKHTGWVDWGDWLGTGATATYLRRYRSFKQARQFVRNLNLKSEPEWRRYCKGKFPDKEPKPADVPYSPDTVYKNKGWVDWGDWLGTGHVWKREWMPFAQARKFVRRQGLSGNSQWRKYCHGQLLGTKPKPENIPSAPDRIYRDKGWINWGDWLGTRSVAPQLKTYRPFKQARRFALNLGLKCQKEWYMFCKGELPEKGTMPDDIPKAPHHAYRDKGWISWGDWLGTDSIGYSYIKYRSFKDARRFAQSLNLRNHAEWNEYCKGKLSHKKAKPDDIPITADKVYKNKGWISWGDWLGTGIIANIHKKFRPFVQAREFVRSLNLKNRTEWKRYCKGEFPEKGAKPDDIPSVPDKVYRNRGWVGMGDWLGTENMTFYEARKFARSLNLKSNSEWRRYCKGELADKGMKPNYIPSAPNYVYRDKGWVSWFDWLGKNN